MTVEEVRERIHSQVDGHLSEMKHGITLKQALIPPKEITLIVRIVLAGRIKESKETVWLVGRESADGYKIVMREEVPQFGLASSGFPSDHYPVLVGWYGDLLTTFMAM